MAFMRRILTSGAVTLAAAAVASPALAQESDVDAGTSSGPTTYCRDSAQYPREGDVITSSEQPPGGWHECEPGEAEGYRDARARRRQREADAREAQSKQFQANIDREQAEADKLEEQATLCDKQPSACSPYSRVSPAKPAPPKAVSYVAAQQEKVSRHANPARVEARPVADRPGDKGVEDAIDVPDTVGFAVVDPALRPGPRNLVWFSFVAMAAIASLGYGLWRVLFIGDV